MLLFFGRLYEKDHVVGLLTPGNKKKEYLCSYFYDRPYEKICEAKLLAPISFRKMLEIA
ncbi:MAG: hypothetical protein HXL10_00505 [Candidatus Nanosynbacter sp.]|nr:hypothetical protein [Candidatus Nanosynbacter sp.]